jgi:hypothetical protein
MRRGICELLSDLKHVLVVALLYLFLEELLERAIAQPFFALLREVGHEIRDERTSEPLRLGVRIIREKRIDRWTRRSRR